jgi:Flp pilus assembly protein TadG
MHMEALASRIPPVRKRNEKGIILLLGSLSMPIIVSMMGLAIDASIVYSVKAKIQLAADGASLAAARGLSVGLTTAAQLSSAQNNATNWFNKNFPSGTFGTSNIVLDTPQIFDDPVQPLIRHVIVTANTDAPSYFMRFWGRTSTHLTGFSEATRRDSVIMMVLDRSGSMNTPGGACAQMKAAAKTFTGSFSQQRDRIGLITFNMASYVASSPVLDFKTVLGYSDSSGSASGLIDNISCNGGTGTPQATILGYNELYKTALPGAINVVLVFTDGEPNVIVPDFRGGLTSQMGIMEDTTTCQDSRGYSLNSSASPRGHIGNYPRNWSSGRTMGSGAFLADVLPGPTMAIYADSSQTIWGRKWVSTSLNSTSDDAAISTSGGLPNAAGCNFSNSYSNNIQWLPDTDVFGTPIELSGYYSLSRVTYDGASRIDATNYNIHYGAYNASANAASRARTSRTLPDGRDFPGAFVYCIGLGNVNHTLLQRMANDPGADPGGAYPAFTGYDTTQPIGSYVYASNESKLRSAFAQIASFILRLNQ